MLRAVSVVIGAGLLAGCVTMDTPTYAKSRFPDYRSMLAADVLAVIDRGTYGRIAPIDVRKAYADCSAGFILGKMTGADQARLDAYARQEIPMSWNETKDVDRRMRSAIGSDITYETLDRLGETCPDQVASFKENFAPLYRAQDGLSQP